MPPRIGFVQEKLQGFGGLEKYGVHFIQLLSERAPLDVLSEHSVDPGAVERAFGLRLDGPRFLCDPRCSPRLRPSGRLQGSLDRRRALSDYEAVTRPYDLVVAHAGTLPWRCRARRSLLICHFPVVRRQRLDPSTVSGERRSLLTARGRELRDIRSRLDSWTRIIANSEFTRGWIRRYWERDSDVIYPPIDLPSSPDLSTKGPWILGIGFFSPPERGDRWGYKRHGLLIETFRELHDRGLRGWELHLAGHMLEEPPCQAYLDELRGQARGYPVHFHVNCAHSELVSLYRHGSLFWHATGYGIDAEIYPEKMEHFGIVTAEAMGWGCVPVVVARGGQPEIVEHEVSGFLWESVDELRSATLRLVGDEGLRAGMAAAAVARAQRFGLPRFRAQVSALVDEELSHLQCTS